MITVFEYETPIRDAIKAQFISVVDDYEDSEGNTPYAGSSDKILFSDYEMSEDEILATPDNYDGVIMDYASNSNYVEGKQTQTGDADSDNSFTVVCIGFGDVSTEGTFDDKTGVKVATERAQELCRIAFKAIMNRTELAKSYNSFRTTPIEDIKKIKEKFITGCEKRDVVGAVSSTRAMVIYQQTYTLRFTDIAPTEPLGSAYTGSDGFIETED